MDCPNISRMGVLLAVVVGSACLTSCAHKGTAEPDLLRSADGQESAFPSLDWCKRLQQAPDDEKRRLVGQLARVLNGPGGYSRIVAANALLMFFESSGPEFMTEEAVRALADNAIRLSKAPGDITRQGLEEHPEFVDLLQPWCVVFFDCEDFSLCEGAPGLPKGWLAQSAEILLDGESLPVTVNAHSFERSGEAFTGVSGRLKARNPETYERHVIEYRLTVRAPNGTVVPIVQKCVLYLVGPEDVDVLRS